MPGSLAPGSVIGGGEQAVAQYAGAK